jgi:Predicted membrane protein
MDYVRYLFSFGGRINRARYLVVQLTLLTVWFLLWVKSPFQQWEILGLAAVVPMIWINLATTAKRLHDRNRRGWWAIAVVVVNRLSLLYYGLFSGSLSASIFRSPGIAAGDGGCWPVRSANLDSSSSCFS